MFFSGDPSSRKRVDLGGRSSKESDRQKLLEQTRLERNRRLLIRQQNSAALNIQRCFRGRKVVEVERCKVREKFFSTYGQHCENVNRQCFGTDSNFLSQLLFFFKPRHIADFSALVETCRLLREFTQDSGNIVNTFAGSDYLSNQDLVDYRVKVLAYACIRAVYENRDQLKGQLLSTPEKSIQPENVLMEALGMLIDRRLPWACKTVCYLFDEMDIDSLGFDSTMFREIIQMEKENFQGSTGSITSLERVLTLLISHTGEASCTCSDFDTHLSFLHEILVIPFLWQLFPHLKEIFSSHVGQHFLHQMRSRLKDGYTAPRGLQSRDFPFYACLLGNLLEAAKVAVIQPSPSAWAMDFAIVGAFLLQELPPEKSIGDKMDEDEMLVGDDHKEVLSIDLRQQISSALDPHFLLQLTNILLGAMPRRSGSQEARPGDEELSAVSAACSLLYATFNILPLDRVMTVLAYRTELVPILWNIMKKCQENEMWSSLSSHRAYPTVDAPGWLLPLAVFCPIYKHMLMIVDNEEFYEQEKPLSLKDIQLLIIILRQVLWQILWLNPSLTQNISIPILGCEAIKREPLEFLQYRVCMVASELMSQLQDWNNRREFTSPSNFNADGANDIFMSQAIMEISRANEILRRAPFLVPFTSRANIFNSQLASRRKRHGAHAIFTRFKIRRDHILEDAFSQLDGLAEEDLRGVIQVTFVNELGVEEAGIDGGGIFKDFMETITRAAFNVQYGLFKETADHLLYPNPGSGLVHEQHLQYFHFLGTILGKAMFEGILVDIPFATFFLSKLKQRYNYLNDLPSLDPELYRHLIFLKHYDRDFSELELYFVIVNNEYGEHTEEELLPGGKSIQVTNDNVITYIHLVANHRLNYQIRQQSTHFLRGFQQLIHQDWIDMFNEHELQLLISGSVDGFDMDDLREHTEYTGGYQRLLEFNTSNDAMHIGSQRKQPLCIITRDHYVIGMFWEVIKNMGLENQRNFLKFATGCSRGPLFGFKCLEPRFCIQRTSGEASEQALDRLPTSSTCMNLLKLPPYRSKEQLEQKLLYAINSSPGFDLS